MNQTDNGVHSARKPVAVVVMGDVARSPRMINHARELAASGFPAVLIGYRGRGFEPPAGVRVVALDGGQSAPRDASALRFALMSGLRMSRLFFALLRTLVREKPGAILLQNPPSFPTLTAATVAARFVGCRVLVDWHNYGFSLLGLRLGKSHPLTRLARWYEFAAGRRADGHFCVSKAMRDDLKQDAGIRAAVLYDRPWFVFREDASRHAAAETAACLNVVCPAGWASDEDMEMLVDALELLPRDSGLRVYVTGEGPKRVELVTRLSGLRDKGLLLDTGYVPDEEYWRLIRTADLGLSLHRSSSGLDLAMKVVDLFGAGVPVCAFDYGGSIGEQVVEGETGFLFRTAEELAALLARIGSHPEIPAELRTTVRQRWPPSPFAGSWSEEWRTVVLPVLGDPQ